MRSCRQSATPVGILYTIKTNNTNPRGVIIITFHFEEKKKKLKRKQFENKIDVENGYWFIKHNRNKLKRKKKDTSPTFTIIISSYYYIKQIAAEESNNMNR